MASRIGRAFGLVLAALAVAAALAACGPHGSTVPAASAAARVSAEATSTAAQQAKKDLLRVSVKCGTVTAAGQIAAVKAIGSHAGRQALMAKCGVPASRRPQVEAQLLGAAEKGHLVSGGHPARVKYFTVTMPGIILAAQA
jgi:hypothetical protein